MNESYEELMTPLAYRLGERGGEVARCDETEPTLQPCGREDMTDVVAAANAAASAHRAATRALEDEVLAFLYVQPPKFFESVIIDLMLAMGYASRRRDLAAQIGRSHDGGVDGIIRQDPLGLDVILLQAKRLKPNTTVSAGQVRDFIGTLSTRKATKGVFVTTGSFSGFARSTIDQVALRVTLIDGRLLSALMVRHNLGVRPVQSFTFKQLDHAYFNLPQACATAS